MSFFNIKKSQTPKLVSSKEGRLDSKTSPHSQSTSSLIKTSNSVLKKYLYSPKITLDRPEPILIKEADIIKVSPNLVCTKKLSPSLTSSTLRVVKTIKLVKK